MVDPAGGVHQLGSLAFWYEYVESNGESQIAHTSMGKVVEPMLAAYLVPYWSGELGGGKWLNYLMFAGAAAGVGYGAYRIAMARR